RRYNSVPRERPRQEHPRFGVSRTQFPERVERASEAKGDLIFPVVQCPIERLRKVRILDIEPGKPCIRPLSPKVRLCLFSELDEMLCMLPGDWVRLSAAHQ